MDLLAELERYVVNVDFPTAKVEGGHKIHLNPYSDMSPEMTTKVLKRYDPIVPKRHPDGGPVYLDEEELQAALVRDSVVWEGKEASPLRACRVCAELPDWRSSE